MDKVSSFFVGNVVGITILVTGVLITAPKKLKETEAIKQEQVATAPVVVADKEISRGEKIAQDELVVKSLAGKIDADAISDVNKIVGKTAKLDIHKGAAITAGDLEDTESN